MKTRVCNQSFLKLLTSIGYEPALAPHMIKTWHRTAKAFVAACSVMMSHAALASPCRVIDAYTPVALLSRQAVLVPPVDQVQAFRHSVIARYPYLYAQQVLTLSAGQDIDALILTSLASARRSQARTELVTRLRHLVERTQASFAKLNGFRCDFPIYLTDSLGQFDGAGRIVDGRRSLVLGVDTLDAEQDRISLRVFLAHEIFHRYHFMVGGFSDDAADRQPLWRTLWAEGLATYASRTLNPGATIGQALMLPTDLAKRAAPLTPQIAADMLSHLDEVNPDVYRTYFTYGNKAVTARGLPWRSGYYVGYLVAARLARRHTLSALAHLPPRRVHMMVRVALQTLAS